jgi:2'-5' RNA ligase
MSPPGPSPDAGGAIADPDLLTGRLFFGIEVPPPARAPLEALQPELARTLPGARLTEPSGWHLTLAFLGQVRPESGADVVAAGEHAAYGPAGREASLRLEGAGAFPGRTRARVLWAGIGGEVEVLSELAARLADACRAAGLRHEDRALQAHLTLARLRVPEPLPDRLLARVADAAASAPGWRARALHCYRSILGNRGARYEIVRSFPLRAG